MPHEGGLGRSPASDAVIAVLESMGTAYFALDSTDVILYLNSVGERLLDRSRDAAVGRSMWDLFPGAQHVVFGPAYDEARRSGEPIMLEAWAPTLQRWLEIRVVPDGDALSVFLIDVTARHTAQDAARRATTRFELLLEVSEQLSSAPNPEAGLRRLVGLVVPALGDWAIATVVGDGVTEPRLRDVGSAHVDPAQERVAARYAHLRIGSLTDTSPLIRAMHSDRPELVRENATDVVAASLEPGEARELLRGLHPESLAILPLRANGRTLGMLSLFGSAALDDTQLRLASEVTARASLAVDNARAYAAARRSQAEAEAAAQQLRLLADVSQLLAHGKDLEVAVGELARLVVPQLADWCTVTIVTGNDSIRTQGWAHRDPEMEPALARYAAVQADSMNEDAAIAVCLRTGEPVVIPDLPALASWVPDDQASALLATLAPRSVAVLPLNANDRTLGAMALVTLADRGPHSPELLQTALEVAGRAGLALDNARLYGEQRQLAEALQRSLLTSPPQDGPLEIAVRYVPAATEAQVGGDWYDAFRLPDGDVMLVIGDVMGHDGLAAGRMSQLRGVLRTLAYGNADDSTSSILVRAEETARGLGLDTLATAILARVSYSDVGAMISWSNAGHPPPILLHADGTGEVLARGNDLLLGVDADTERSQHSRELPAGSTLLLFTDGLVERRDADVDTGVRLLLAAIADLATAPLEELCDAALTRMDARAGNDDVALLAVRSA